MRQNRLVLIPVALVGAVLASLYLYQAFFSPSPDLRVALRTIPILPLAIWTLWFDAGRPLRTAAGPVRTVGRVFLLLVVMTFALLLLGLGLNAIYDPSRVI